MSRTAQLLKCCNAVFEKLHHNPSGVILGTGEVHHVVSRLWKCCNAVQQLLQRSTWKLAGQSSFEKVAATGRPGPEAAFQTLPFSRFVLRTMCHKRRANMITGTDTYSHALNMSPLHGQSVPKHFLARIILCEQVSPIWQYQRDGEREPAFTDNCRHDLSRICAQVPEHGHGCFRITCPVGPERKYREEKNCRNPILSLSYPTKPPSPELLWKRHSSRCFWREAIWDAF